jgi:hypothetical protein
LFERPHHQRIATVLESLDAATLESAHCLFGGGTAIVLAHGEFRESRDIDFVVSDAAGYRSLRALLTGPSGFDALLRSRERVRAAREVRADQYGLRTSVEVDAEPIKFEIVFEARITLAPPGRDDRICGVATLAPIDAVATKLLANSDRWRDDAVMSRDLIDLAMLAPSRPLLQAALAKARASVYGDSVDADLARAVAMLRERPHRLDACLAAMHITAVSKAQLWSRIRTLERRARLAP